MVSISHRQETKRIVKIDKYLTKQVVKIDLQITKKQDLFIKSSADETLFGGAAGGGKSYGQIVDSLLFALRYPKSKQLVLRRTFPELKRSLILTSQELFPKDIGQYKETTKKWQFINGSTIEFGYCESESDVTQYQSAEYDCIRFDELTHFTEYQYIYMLSRLRGANNHPKQVKSSTNPGGVGHAWVKKRFIDTIAPESLYTDETGRTRLFIPSKVQDNRFLMDSDPDYLKRLESLPEAEKKALLLGDWNIFEGQYFDEFDKSIHVVKPFSLPDYWRRYRVLDYGLDMLACYWVAVDEQSRPYVYKELYQSDLIISEAAKKILEMTDEDIFCTFAPPDLWNRRQDTGKSARDIFAENGVLLVIAKNDRVTGWFAVKEHLKPCIDEFGTVSSKLKIFDTCVNLIRCLPALLRDKKNPSDVAKEPHELTHAPDALRYFCMSYTLPAEKPIEEDYRTYEDETQDFITYGM